ncbi:quinoprotein glucose dehydrogenase [Spongiactinospora rosea]|uniref:Quinoprotein glucose dehydrogenase n=1 Tax=Spongiactinospora rosea TaxID=2248750 RepID=A0A366LWW1_9ACTN|nr:PQQ-dependent sugar dehydrogenase [Spongiactinospora rosea]RBQ18050.1 quinoprotein glucose dehydrogenase [Spongiactinospora rosea]
MRAILRLCTAASVLTGLAVSAPPQPRVVATGLKDPYEIVMGPDGHLWVTEKSGLAVKRVKPDTGEVTTVLNLSGQAAHTRLGTKDGVLGLALHPDLGKGTEADHVYLSYTHKGAGGNTTRLVRYTWADGRLANPRDVLIELPSSVDHQSARLRYGPDGMLYYSIGDQGNNYETRHCHPNHAQTLPTADQVADRDWSAYQGKILRMEPDGSVPADNPEINGVRSHVYAYGFRNPDGLAFKGDGLYAVDHGPSTDDELNKIQAGANYGWPNVAGFKDDKAYVYGAWAEAPNCAGLPYDPNKIPRQVPQTKESAFTKDAQEPLFTFGTTVESGTDFGPRPPCNDPKTAYVCWPTLAPSSLEAAGDDLLVTMLKEGVVQRISSTGKPKDELYRTVDRYRDTALSADGKTLYIATDLAGVPTRDARGAPTTKPANPGTILAVPLG